jgi:hypothetical protein
VSPPREARLKPEFALLYPDVAAGVWLLAAHVADTLAALARKDPEGDVLRRVLDESHFEFRGGSPAGVPHVVRDRIMRIGIPARQRRGPRTDREQ